MAQSTTSAASLGHPNQYGTSSSKSDCQCQKRLYALQAHREQEGSLDVVTATLRFFHVDVYAFYMQGLRISFVTSYIEVNFGVSLETLSKTFSISLKSVTQLYLHRYTKVPLAQSLKKSPQYIL